MAALRGVLAPSRKLNGVICIDIGRDVTDLVHRHRSLPGPGSARAILLDGLRLVETAVERALTGIVSRTDR